MFQLSAWARHQLVSIGNFRSGNSRYKRCRQHWTMRALRSVDAIVVGNALGGTLSDQNHLGALFADFAGLRGTERTVLRLQMHQVAWRSARAA